MGSIDDITWQALTVALTLVGLATTGLLWRSRGPVAGLRALAFSLLPAAAYLTGTLRLLWEIGDAVASWAVRFVFSPSVWLGVILAGMSVTLFALTAFLRRRGGTTEEPGARRTRRREPKAAPAGTPKAALGDRRSAPAAGTTGDDDMDDIEAILKRHGIS